MASPLQDAIQFLSDLGFFDVLIPFLLIFTLVFAILEKTRILGSEDEGKTPKRNLDAIVAFVFALLVVATQQIVNAINTALPQIALILVIILSFMLLAGSFLKTGEFSFSESRGWRLFLTYTVFVGIILIFLAGVKNEDGDSWLQTAWDFTTDNLGSGSAVIWTIILLVVLISVIAIVVRQPKSKS